MRQFIKKITFPFLNTWYQRKTNKVNYYTKYDIRLKINPGVFHPGIFFSTDILISFLDQFEMKNKKILELGAGSGMISFFLAKAGAIVTATDISQSALKGLAENSKTNQLLITVKESNLFQNVSPNEFDIIVINPPYYAKNPNSEKEQAFFCGDDFQYFRTLFYELGSQWNGSNIIYMILSQDCKIQRINSIANTNNIIVNKIYTTKKWGEENYIFKIEKESK